MPASITYIIIIAVVLYIIVCQFIEQPVKPLMLLGLPVAVAYVSYIAFQKNLAEAFVNPGLLIAALVIGFLPGLCLGLYRGTLVRVRRDVATGITYVKPSRLSIAIWITLLVLRIAAIAVTYVRLDREQPYTQCFPCSIRCPQNSKRNRCNATSGVHANRRCRASS